MTDESDESDDESATSHVEDLDLSREYAAERLADEGLLTKQQAHAYLLRDVSGYGRIAAADKMGIGTSTLDDHITAARDKIEAARGTVEELERLERDE